MKLIIKNMLSDRCKQLVNEELNKMAISHDPVKIGEVQLHSGLTVEQFDELKERLAHIGLLVIEDKRKMLIERIKSIIQSLIYQSGDIPKVKHSSYISERVDRDYNYLAGLFSELEGITIEQYIIAHRVERVKELILEGRLTITEIAHRLQFSSVAHLSNQFKKITGLTPTRFKEKQLSGFEFEPVHQESLRNIA